MLPEFNLLTPQTLAEALDMLAESAPDAVPLAGGTNLIVDLRDRRQCPAVLVNVAELAELRGIRQENGHVVMGGGTTIAEMLNDPLIAQHAPVLQDAARIFANPLVRHRATVAGNLVYGSPAANTPPPLLVLDAEVELASQAGVRRVPLDDFLVGVRETACRPAELLTAVRWPTPAQHSAAAFRKVGLRKSDAIAVLNVAVRVTQRADGVCEQTRIALGSVAPRVIRARAAEESLLGQPLTETAIAEAARLAAEATRCISDIRGSADYRRRVTEVLVRRLLTQVAGEVK
ncbi:MAG TPA: xanthine dehydrogenase family protein subunit M [Chloroflexi bacterium]|nr:xanthine dehydrogenase family protein subunit M [Chloroflexota bacterium]